MSGFRGKDCLRLGDYVYIIRRRSDGKLKIGASGQLSIRMPCLNKEHNGVDILGITDGYKALEAELHERFAEHRIWTEGWRNNPTPTDWFEPAQEILDWIQENMYAFEKRTYFS